MAPAAPAAAPAKALSSKALDELVPDWGKLTSAVDDKSRNIVLRILEQGLGMGLDPEKDLWVYALDHPMLKDPGPDADWRTTQSIEMRRAMVKALGTRAARNVLGQRQVAKELEEEEKRKKERSETVARVGESLFDAAPTWYSSLFKGQPVPEGEWEKLQQRAKRQSGSIAKTATTAGQADGRMKDWLLAEYYKLHPEAKTEKPKTRAELAREQQSTDAQEWTDYLGTLGELGEHAGYAQEAGDRILKGTSSFAGERAALENRMQPPRQAADPNVVSAGTLRKKVDEQMDHFNEEMARIRRLSGNEQASPAAKEQLVRDEEDLVTKSPLNRSEILAALKARDASGNPVYVEDEREFLMKVWEAKNYGEVGEVDAE